MARIRTIKPEFFHSKSTARVSRDARLTFAGLWTVADDEGRFRGDERILAGALWSNDDDITHVEVAAHLKELEHEDMICRYELGGREYVHVVHWAEHQRINRPTPSRLPACPLHDGQGDSVSPPGGLSEDSVRTHGALKRNQVPEVGSRKEEVGKRRSSKHLVNSTAPVQEALVVTPAGATESETPTSFDKFWETYPRRVGKQAAKAAWSKAAKRTQAQTIVDGARRYAADPNLPEPKFIPHPATWLNQGRWEDEPCAPRAGTQPKTSGSVTDARVQDAMQRIVRMQAAERAATDTPRPPPALPPRSRPPARP